MIKKLLFRFGFIHMDDATDAIDRHKKYWETMIIDKNPVTMEAQRQKGIRLGYDMAVGAIKLILPDDLKPKK